MSIKFVANDVWAEAVDLRTTDELDAETTDNDKIQNVTTGRRDLHWTQTGTDARRVVYINKSGGMSYDTCILQDADNHNTHSVKIIDWTTYTGSSTTQFTTSNFAETLIGRDSTDWAYDVGSQTSLQAVGIEFDDGSGGAYTKTIPKLYFGNAVEITNPPRIERELLPKYSTIMIGHQAYPVVEQITMEFDYLTDALAESIDELYMAHKEPIFVWDANANSIREKLLHVIIEARNIRKVYNNHNELRLSLGVLEHY